MAASLGTNAVIVTRVYCIHYEKDEKKKSHYKLLARPQSIIILSSVQIERKAMIKNRYNYLTPSVRDAKGKEGRT